MKVRIKQNCKGSPDGIHINEYKKNEEVELPDDLATAFIGLGWAELIKTESPKKKKLIKR